VARARGTFARSRVIPGRAGRVTFAWSGCFYGKTSARFRYLSKKP
jgi:hypothetical protein